MVTTTKTCTKCKGVKPLTEFYTKGEGLLRSDCKECSKRVVRATIRQRVEAERQTKKQSFRCACCGKSFHPVYGEKNRKYCSEICQKKTENANKDYRKQARRYGVKVELIAHFQIFQRDKWKCQRCGIPTPRAKRGTREADAPEMHHIVPLHLGGSHVKANVQCYCRSCNRGAMAEVYRQTRVKRLIRQAYD